MLKKVVTINNNFIIKNYGYKDGLRSMEQFFY